MKGIPKLDLITGFITGDADGVDLPHNELQYLRYNPKTKKVIDIRQLPQPYKFYIDEKGIKHILQLDPSWQPLECNWDDELVNDNGMWRVKTEEEKLQERKEQNKRNMLRLQKERLEQILDRYGYIDLADVQYYTSQNDTEAKAILSWYQAYDDGIWNWIDNTLASLETLEELVQIDIRAVEEEIFNQSVQKSPLP